MIAQEWESYFMMSEKPIFVKLVREFWLFTKSTSKEITSSIMSIRVLMKQKHITCAIKCLEERKVIYDKSKQIS